VFSRNTFDNFITVTVTHAAQP